MSINWKAHLKTFLDSYIEMIFSPLTWLVVLAVLALYLLLSGRAHAECFTSSHPVFKAHPGSDTHATWNMIDGRKCWYARGQKPGWDNPSAESEVMQTAPDRKERSHHTPDSRPRPAKKLAGAVPLPRPRPDLELEAALHEPRIDPAEGQRLADEVLPIIDASWDVMFLRRATAMAGR